MTWIDAVKLAGAFAVPLVAVAGLFYAMMNAGLKNLGSAIQGDMKRIEGKVDALAADHNALARELSEVKGYLRGTLPESSGRGPTANQQT